MNQKSIKSWCNALQMSLCKFFQHCVQWMIDFVISLSAIEGTIPMTPSRRSANERRADAIISTEMESLFSEYPQHVCVQKIIFWVIQVIQVRVVIFRQRLYLGCFGPLTLPMTKLHNSKWWVFFGGCCAEMSLESRSELKSDWLKIYSAL